MRTLTMEKITWKEVEVMIILMKDQLTSYSPLLNSIRRRKTEEIKINLITARIFRTILSCKKRRHNDSKAICDLLGRVL